MALYPAPAGWGSSLGWAPPLLPTGVGTASFSAVRLSATFLGRLPPHCLLISSSGSKLVACY